MAVEATEIYLRHPDCFDAESLALAREGDNPFNFKGLTFSQTVNESKAINSAKGPTIIVSASGMCNAGRIVHHLALRLPDPHTALIFVGFQAQGTLGRRILDETVVIIVDR
jgi:metallo-beta-lactamase family protein